MKKLINDPKQVVAEMTEGLVLADGRLALLEDETVVLRADHAAVRDAGQVAIVSGGGSGHEPAHAGYVGRGMLTAAVAGPVFTSPSVDAVLKAILAVGGPGGVLLIVKNYTGDKLNFGLAAEIARTHGLQVAMVVVGDDVALGEANVAVGRRGIAGTVLVHKIAGAAAEEGLSLAQVRDAAQRAAAGLASMGVGLSACTVPEAGEPGFALGADEIEFGLGIHGESGVHRSAIQPADAIVDTLLDQIVSQGGLQAGEDVALMVNGLGGTPAIELSIVARRALMRLAEQGLQVRAAMVGTFLGALEMAGCSLSVMRLDDARTRHLLAPTAASAWSAPTIPSGAATRVPSPVVDAPQDALGAPWSDARLHERFAAVMRAVIQALIAAEPELTRLDSAVGDGDLGISLSRGARAVDDAFATLDLAHPAHALEQVSYLLRRALGGTSGPLYAMFVLRAARSLAEAADPGAVAAWADAFAAGCEGITRLGGAVAGDRTMLDALLPAASALAGSPLASDAIRAATRAAVDGAESTRTMAPRLGRSSYLGARTSGHADPGAVAVSMWLAAIEGVLA